MADALAVALVYLNRRERTVAEVRARLEKGDFEAAEIGAAVDELVELGYLDDGRYARLYVEDRRALDRWGTDRIARNLLERGVDREVVDAALAMSADPHRDDNRGQPDSELGRAIAVLRDRFPRPLAERRDRERAFGMLVRKGYDSELSADAIRAWNAGAGEEPDGSDGGGRSLVAESPLRYYDG